MAQANTCTPWRRRARARRLGIAVEIRSRQAAGGPLQGSKRVGKGASKKQRKVEFTEPPVGPYRKFTAFAVQGPTGLAPGHVLPRHSICAKGDLAHPHAPHIAPSFRRCRPSQPSFQLVITAACSHGTYKCAYQVHRVPIKRYGVLRTS
jgi:hypothetical protein